MVCKISFLTLLIAVLFNLHLKGQEQKRYSAIYSGIPWFDSGNNVVSAHGACIVKDNDLYYLFGEYKSDTSNAFSGFSCYSSVDLMNWKFENMALPVQDSGKLGPRRVGERVKVLKCPGTSEYVMFMHTDNLYYTDPCVGYATSGKIDGTYTFRGPLLFNGNPVPMWDMGVFQDSDGSGYLVTHSGNIFRLSDDYKSITGQTAKNTGRGESPAIFKKDSIYYWLTSSLTSWERNDNFYSTATSLSGPWTERGLFCPEGTLTWNSQTTYVLTIPGTEDTTFMFMGDRWAFPRQRSAATCVWQPLKVRGYSISIPDFTEAWNINLLTGKSMSSETGKNFVENTDTALLNYSGIWSHTAVNKATVSTSGSAGSSVKTRFTGRQAGIYGMLTPLGGYAEIRLINRKGETVLTSTVDMYCKYPAGSLVFLSPLLKKDKYTLTLTVTGEHGNWSNKKGKVYGSTGNLVAIDKILIGK